MAISKKITFFVVLGNILEYYDFLLFAHLGFVITPLFFPDMSSKQTHILSLFLFGMSFVIRPIGGIIFGRISDYQGRKAALVQSTQWAIIPALVLCFLPSFDLIGIAATYLFVGLRLLQGIALGGEYTAAGTYLMECHSKNKGFISGILAASGTVGSLIGFGISFVCLQKWGHDWLWRVAFLIGAIGGIYNFHMRKVLLDQKYFSNIKKKSLNFAIHKRGVMLVIAIGAIVGLTVWLPMTYTNFYLTKIQGMDLNVGLTATFVALVTYIILMPIFGYLSDRFSHYYYMMVMAFLIIPMSMFSFSLLIEGHVILAQIGLIIAAASIGAPIHVVMNEVFPVESRGRFVSSFFMIGLSLGGLAPSLSGYIVDKTGFHFTPALLLSGAALITGIIFYKTRRIADDSLEQIKMSEAA